MGVSHRLMCATLGALAAIGISTSVRAAAVVTGVTTPVLDIGTATSTTGITPYSSDGYALFATGPNGGGAFGPTAGTDILQLPTYVNPGTFTTAGENKASGFNYESVVTPNGTVTPGTLTDGTATNKFSFALQGTVPSVFTVGLLVDNLDSPDYNASALTIATTGGSTATVAEATGNRNPDLYFFTISGASAGDTVTVGATQGVNGTATIAGITFASTPLPASVWGGMALLAGFGLTRLGKRAIA
jgi:hypothetical protein